MRATFTLCFLATLSLALPIASPPAGARPTAVSPQVRQAAPGPVRRISPHWAGYVTTARRSFTAVQATWIQPGIRCDRPDSSVAFWVGLGGATRNAQCLEQIGTSADCSNTLVPSYSAWSEVMPVPARSVELPVSVAPGDKISALITTEGMTLTLALRNETTNEVSTTETTPPLLDLSSAEWIAEAPSFCLYGCTTLPLANFGKVTFIGATASDDAHAGTISDPAWTRHSIKLTTTKRRPAALPSPLSADGRSFSVRWRGTR
jgi:hypothetical protein